MAGQPITLTIPAVGTAGTTYASQINTALSTLETELERKVVPADMTINAGLSFLSSGSYYPATDLKYVQLSLQSESALAAASYPMSLFAGSTDGELYFNDNSGRQIQITTNGSVNVSTSGGVTGSGYGSTGVEIRWDSGDGEYEFRSGSGTNDYADLRADDVLLSDGSTNFVTLTAQAMASDYTITLPAAVPASTSVVQMSSAGTLTASPSGNIATTGTVATGALTVTGSATVSTTLGVTGASTFTGLVTANAGVTIAVNENLTLSGNGRIKHGNEQIVIPGLAFQPPTETADIEYTATAGIRNSSSTDITCYAPLILPKGKRIVALTWVIAHAVGATSRDYIILKYNARTLTSTTVDTQSSSTSNDTSVEVAASFTETIAEDYCYVLKATLTENGDELRAVIVTYDGP